MCRVFGYQTTQIAFSDLKKRTTNERKMTLEMHTGSRIKKIISVKDKNIAFHSNEWTNEK